MLNVVNVTPERDLAVGRLIVDCIAGLACAMKTAVPRASAQEQAEPRRLEWAGREWAVHVQYPQRVWQSLPRLSGVRSAGRDPRVPRARSR